jgi:hypothetical protein
LPIFLALAGQALLFFEKKEAKKHSSNNDPLEKFEGFGKPN